MAKPFDATMRELFELEPAAWLEFLGIAVPDPNLVQVIDSNVSTITAETDKVLRIDGPEPLIVHAEFLSARDLGYPAQCLWYNTLLERRHKLPVWSVLVLIRPAADGPELTGTFERVCPGRGRNLWFGYDVVRVWREPPEKLLTGGLPLLPLAPVSDVDAASLPAVLTSVAERLKREAPEELKKILWASTLLLMCARYPREQVEEMMEEVTTMVLGIRGIEDSWLYQDILAEGMAKGRAEGEAKGETRGLAEGLLRIGRRTLGPPGEQVTATLLASTNREQLDRLYDRIAEAATWDDLLAPLTVPENGE